MKLTISRRTGLIVAGTLLITLTIMLIFLLGDVENSQKAKIRKNVNETSEAISQSIKFCMEQGINDVSEYISRAEKIENVSELRIIPTDKIIPGSERSMDPQEKNVLATGKSKFYEEDFKNEKVCRSIKPILAEKVCLKCHDTKEKDPLAVISLRYSIKADYASIARQRLGAILTTLGAIILSFLILMVFLKKYFIKDLLLSVNDIKKLATGDTGDVVELSRKDELGTLSGSIKKLQTAMKGQSEVAVEIAKGNLSADVLLLSQNDTLGKAMLKMENSISSLINDIYGMAEAAKNGDLYKRVDEGKHSGDYGKIVKGFNETLDAFCFPIEANSKVLAEMAGGDFTARLEGEYNGDFNTIKESTNKVAESMSAAILHFSRAIETTADSSVQISDSIEEMAAGSDEQASQTSEVAAAIEEMTRTIFETTKNAGRAADNAKIAGEIAYEGGKVVQDTVERMEAISQVVASAAQTVQQLGRNSGQIGEIIQVIEDIADQTNLLALNAAIEAARAGETGRGFAVVADEVRKLAERTTKATKEIAGMIKNVQQDTDKAVLSIEQGTKEVEKGREMANKAGESLKEIIEASNRVLDEVTQVAGASEEQSASAEQISKNIDEINNISKESSAGIKKIAVSADKLNDLMNNLRSLINNFKISVEEEKTTHNPRTRKRSLIEA